MKVAVFGASGFVGINVVNAFQKAGIDVIASDIRESQYLNCEFKAADLLDYDRYRQLSRGVILLFILQQARFQSLLRNRG